MSIQKKFHAYPWVFSIVCALILALIAAVTVGLLCNCFWEITEIRILNFLYGICPCLDTIAHPNLPTNILDERRITALYREEAHRLTDLANGLADIRTAVETLLEDNGVLNPTSDTTSQQFLSGITIHQSPRQSPMEERSLPLVGASASSIAQPSNSTVSARLMLFLPSRTPFMVWIRVTDFLRKFARGPWHRWRGSVVIQAFLTIDSCVLAEIGELVKKCCFVENGFTLQISCWGIFYYNVDSVHLLILKEGDVPVNIEARWNKTRTGITMRGLYLNGTQIKATTERTTTTLRSSGPPSKGRGNLDELHFPTEGFKGVEESFIHASKVVEFDGISLVVRSEASYVFPRKSFLKEILQDELRKIPALAMKMMKSVLGSIPDLKTKQQLLVEYWKGVSQMEMIDCRNKAIIQFQNWPASEFSTFVGEHALRLITMCPSSRDREYWQRAPHDLSEDPLSIGSSSLSSTVHSTGGRIKFLLGEFDSALLDFDRAIDATTEGLVSTLLDRAMVKCALARYPEAMQDINTAAEINPSSSDIKRFQAGLEELLCMDSSTSSTPLLQPTQPVFDLLNGYHDPILDSPHSYRKIPPILKSLKEFDLPSIPEWTEVRESTKDLPELDLEQGTSQNHEFPQLLLDYLNLYGLTGYDSLGIGIKLAEGGQAEIFEALETAPLDTKTSLVLKVFKQTFSLQNFLEPDVLQFGGVYLDHPSPFLCTALGVKFLRDGRCAFVFPRHWGDLRRLIRQQGVIHSPFEYPTSVKIMLHIAKGMRSLHIRNILHRDLKASNVLVNAGNPAREDFRCMVADFECSVGVAGTGFWRAPEILYELNHRTSESKALAWSKEADVYSFGVTCSEILTGDTPFEDLRPSDWDVVLSGRRPRLPGFLDSKLRMLIERCWHGVPEERPSFSKICKVLVDVKAELAGRLQTHQEWADSDARYYRDNFGVVVEPLLENQDRDNFDEDDEPLLE